ncbi:DUF1576 domain-containing protein [Alkaliphilus peptidifermentans]|uniref:DUF1576 domain-containing protein n=1 Tax=Alkaliphilus peptidifermentans DSM 18978 TaxID=1120976 RepID=A0A1G5J478_9FIRM|nr:DUF1576 domain-containing protein [Alkaliphilus peptidifermentans]SCY83067.1 Protein of unknown function [Alkaliphilus peptidifermentans DSM 18978]
MQESIELKLKVREGEEDVADIIVINEDIKYKIMTAFAVFVLISSLVFNSPREIFDGLLSILVDPSILVSDYMAIGNIGAALFNSGALMIIAIVIAKKNRVDMNGTTMAAVLTVGGFALFGKNLYNVWPIIMGVYFYCKYKNEKFNKFILIALFGTALAPLVSQISFGLGFPILIAVILGNIFGLVAGFVLPALAHHFIKFHQGFNLYNIGFTAGMVGTFFMAVLRAFGVENERRLVIAEGYNQILGIYLALIFIAMFILGFVLNKNSLRGYKRLLKRTGRLVQDFVILDGFGLSLINMSILGIITTGYVLMVRGQLNGPIIGGIFTIVGFGAFGKHLKNVLPVIIGVFLASLIMTWEVNTTGPLLAALFGTTLAPIAGEFGWKSGVVAGFLHMAMVMNVGYLHGGMNLYNNGFSGGMVAAVLVPILEALKRGE